MFSFLNNHPFAVEAFFEKSYVLTFAVPKEELLTFIPECLSLDTFKDKWAFVAMAMVQTKGLRPKGFSIHLGNDFFLIGYRVFVKYMSASGKRLRGLYILKSETDKEKMKFLGNIFTRYNYSTTDIHQNQTSNETIIQSIKSEFEVRFNKNSEQVELPEHSPFSNWKEARRFAGPLPFTFTYDNQSKKVLIIEGERLNWHPKPIGVGKYNISFLRNLHLKNMVLANAFVIKDIPYTWKKGKTELWKT